LSTEGRRMHQRARPSGHATCAHRRIGARNKWLAGGQARCSKPAQSARSLHFDVMAYFSGPPRVRSSSRRDRQPSRRAIHRRPARLFERRHCVPRCLADVPASPREPGIASRGSQRPGWRKQAFVPDTQLSCAQGPPRCLLQCPVPCTRRMDHPDACRGSENPGLRPQVLCFNLQRSAIDSTVTAVLVG